MAINQTVYEVEITGILDQKALIRGMTKHVPNDEYGYKADWQSRSINLYYQSPSYIIYVWLCNHPEAFNYVVHTDEYKKENNTTVTFDDLIIYTHFLDFLAESGMQFTWGSYQMNLLYIGVIKHCPDYYDEYKNVGYWLNRSDAEAWLATDGITDGYIEAEASIDIAILS